VKKKLPVSPAQREMVEQTLQFADKVARELLPLTPKETLLLDVSMAQLKVMFVIFLRGPVRMGILAHDLGVSLPTITEIVNRLEKRDIIVRALDPDDRRVVYCRFTENGQKVLNQLWASARKRTKQMLNALSVEDLSVVQQSLGILLKAGQITRQKEPAPAKS
jgi:DNA-binding MarR family transcriptional regulator